MWEPIVHKTSLLSSLVCQTSRLHTVQLGAVVAFEVNCMI
jgi:hypothetical protein